MSEDLFLKRIYPVLVLGYLILTVSFITNPFWESFISIVIIIATSILALLTLVIINDLYAETDEYGLESKDSKISILFILGLFGFWFSVFVAIFPFLPAWFT